MIITAVIMIIVRVVMALIGAISSTRRRRAPVTLAAARAGATLALMPEASARTLRALLGSGTTEVPRRSRWTIAPMPRRPRHPRPATPTLRHIQRCSGGVRAKKKKKKSTAGSHD